jgi:hypothetical protein
MYIFDGTAMLFAAYFASGGANNSLYTVNKNGSSYFVANDDSGVFGGAKLSDNLNRRIIDSMTDEQVRIMINSLDESDRKVARTAAKEINSPAPVSAEDRAKLQLRCGPLVALLLQFARFIRDVQPKYVAVAFDAGRTTFRTKLYPLYKKHRQPVSAEQLYAQFAQLIVSCIAHIVAHFAGLCDVLATSFLQCVVLLRAVSGHTQLVFAFQTPAMLVPLFPLSVRVLEAVGAVCLAHVG